MNQTQSVVIQKPLAEVFAYMDDLDREVEWQPELVRWEKEPAGPTGVGTRKKYVSQFMGRDIENTYVTEVWEPNERVVYETTKDSSIRVRTEILFEAAGDGTKVTMSVAGKPTGFLKFVPKAILEAQSSAALEASLSRLKANLEGTA